MYDHILTVIEEANDLTTLTMDELMASLQSHEDRMKRHGEHGLIENAFRTQLQLSKC